MIECVFTLDYEIYGDGSGSLKESVYEPAAHLARLFGKRNARFVNFVEVAELEKIDAHATDPYIGLVKRQVKQFHEDGFETGLHLHPQWSNARYRDGRWQLDLSEYNLCTLSRGRIVEIVSQAIAYLRCLLEQPDFVPFSFRAGNWLFQPTQTAASVLREHGIKVDSSVFKGGVQRTHGLDYRRALQNGYFWLFDADVNQPAADGSWMEVPIYAEMVPPWKMATGKRMGFGGYGSVRSSARHKLERMLDFVRFRYPLKLDFCR
ncbi:MAG TPA: hypothetical protein VMB49_01330, partial [Acidobacteriaceae bacterium]|nr:hypothetical protein [Acidobacteriaceae bacterium]